MLFFLILSLFIPFISTRNNTIIKGEDLFYQDIHFIEYPRLKIFADLVTLKNPLSTDEDRFVSLPTNIQDFFVKRETFINLFKKEYFLNSLHRDTKVLLKPLKIEGYVFQIIPVKCKQTEYFLVIMLDKNQNSLYLLFDEFAQLYLTYQIPWTSFGNCIVSLEHSDQVIDVCLNLKQSSGNYSNRICKLQDNGFGVAEKPLQGVFNSNVVKYSSTCLPYPILQNEPKDIFVFKHCIFSPSLMENVEVLPLSAQ